MAAQSGPNRRIGSIEYVGSDGFIVEAADINDPDFIGGKRLFRDFDELLRFLAEHLQVYKSKGNTFGLKRPQDTEERRIQEAGSNGTGQRTPPAEVVQGRV
jgi:hypothetical protein